MSNEMKSQDWLKTPQGRNPKEEILALIAKAKNDYELSGIVGFENLYREMEARLDMLVDIQKYCFYKELRDMVKGEDFKISSSLGELHLKCVKNTILEAK